MNGLLKILKNNAVAVIAVILAASTLFFVPPDKKYIGYFDFPTLLCLFATLLVVEALSEIRFFEILARKIVTKFKNMRKVVFALVFITYFGSMLMANDMALITFLPLGYFALSRSEKREYIAYVFILQNIAANLGGMLTPFGNPQNLFLYSYYSIPIGEFLAVMAPPFVAAFFLIVLCCLFVKKEPVEIKDDIFFTTDKPRLVAYLSLFGVSIAAVLLKNLLPAAAYIGVGVAIAGVAILDFKALKKVNYGLLITFCAFFVFSGNLSRITAVHDLLGGLMEKNALIFTVLSCQAISNVPTATLLCRFTDNFRPLLVGVNIGGLGTPIASLASLITLGAYKRKTGKALRYLGLFLAVNFSFLIILTVFSLIVI